MFAIPVAAPWRTGRLGRHVAFVPCEAMTPSGPPGADDVILRGHSALHASSLSACHWATVCERHPAQVARKNEANPTRCPDKADCNAAKETRTETYQKSLVPKETKQGSGRSIARNRGPFPARPQNWIEFQKMANRAV